LIVVATDAFKAPNSIYQAVKNDARATFGSDDRSSYSIYFAILNNAVYSKYYNGKIRHIYLTSYISPVGREIKGEKLIEK
jgi:hypothetical protein